MKVFIVRYSRGKRIKEGVEMGEKPVKIR